MTKRTLLKFRNADSTADLNDRFRGTFNKGVVTGGTISPVSGVLRVDLAPFVTVGSDGMFVREDSQTTRLDVIAGETNYIVIRQTYVANDNPVVSVENLTETAFLNDGAVGAQGFDNPSLIVFGTVTPPVGAATVSSTDIDYTKSDKVDPLGRLELRGHVQNTAYLPAAGLNKNRPGDFFIVTGGSGDTPSIYVWNGTSWKDATDITGLLAAFTAHAENSTTDQKHLTDEQAFAMESTTGLGGLLPTPVGLSDTNRVVASLDPRMPTTDENDALAGNYVDANSLETAAPDDSNRYITSSKVFAVPTEITYSSVPPTVGSSSAVHLTAANGPYFVGYPSDVEATAGTAQRYFDIILDDVTNELGYLNQDFQNVTVAGVYKDSGLTAELDPADSAVDARGFWNGDLYLKCQPLVDKVPFRVIYGKGTSLGSLLPHLFMVRGPQAAQTSSEVTKFLQTSTNAHFNNSYWDPSVSVGDVVAFNEIISKFVKADPNSGLLPVGVRGNANNLISEGLLSTASSMFTVDMLYADKSNPGKLTSTPNEWYIGKAVATTLLLVNMNHIPLTSSGEVVPPVVFDPSLFSSSLQAGQVAAYVASSGKFEPAEPAKPLKQPVGIKGNNNNIIQNGIYDALMGAPFTAGVKYYASSGGSLTTVANDWLIGEAITSTKLLVNANQAPIGEAFTLASLGNTFAALASENTFTEPQLIKTSLQDPSLKMWNSGGLFPDRRRMELGVTNTGNGYLSAINDAGSSTGSLLFFFDALGGFGKLLFPNPQTRLIVGDGAPDNGAGTITAATDCYNGSNATLDDSDLGTNGGNLPQLDQDNVFTAGMQLGAAGGGMPAAGFLNALGLLQNNQVVISLNSMQLSQNGYIDLHVGNEDVIVQWGVEPVNANSSKTISNNKTFPTAPLWGIAALGNDIPFNATGDASLDNGSLTTTQLTLYNARDFTQNLVWLVIGH